MAVDAGGGCLARAFRYNGTLCACDPGYYLTANGSGCVLFDAGAASDWVVGTAELPRLAFLSTVLPWDTIKRVTQSQAVLLETTMLLLVLWIAGCFALRLAKLRDGRSLLFRIRWWISRVDVLFNTSHWIADNMGVKKRRTELGGTCSVASLILFLGLLTVLLYQIISKWNVTVYRVTPANAPDLLPFVNDLEFNVTTVSSMSCSHLRGLDTLLASATGFVNYRVFPLSAYVEYKCLNTSSGPTVSLKCKSCQIPRRNHFISWQFVDLPNDPATAVGFQFNLSANDHANNRYVTYVSGAVNSESYTNGQPKTFRGPDTNILEIHLFPQVYKQINNLKLVQPLFHDFIPGTYYSVTQDLQASLQGSQDGLVNITLHVSYVADYILEIHKENTVGPVNFLAQVGGLYAISLAIFLFFMLQFEARSKTLRDEGEAMQSTLRRRRAQKNWDKLRKFVMYTWGPCNLDDDNGSKKNGNSVIDSFHKIVTLQKKSQSSGSLNPNSSHGMKEAV